MEWAARWTGNLEAACVRCIACARIMWASGEVHGWQGQVSNSAAWMRAQAVTFLVIHQKHKKSLEEITNDLCPVLSVQQLYRISTMYWDDRYNTETVSHEVRLALMQRPCRACQNLGPSRLLFCLCPPVPREGEVAACVSLCCYSHMGSEQHRELLAYGI